MSNSRATPKPKTRLTPTPSGFLHLGNLYNFLLIDHLARQNDWSVHLRIDDCDASRVRDEYLQDIFDQIDFFQIKVDSGPTGIDDFAENFSQQDKIEHYFRQIQDLKEMFACQCSRKDIAKVFQKTEGLTSGDYPSICEKLEMRFVHGETSVRAKYYDTPGLRGFTLIRKDGGPSYQLVSVVDDVDDQITHVVRGSDLEPSTQAQRWLLSKIHPSLDFPEVHMHPLLASPEGKKRSKSDGDLSLKNLRDRGMTAGEIIQNLSRLLGLQPTDSFAEIIAQKPL